MFDMASAVCATHLRLINFVEAILLPQLKTHMRKDSSYTLSLPVVALIP